MKNQSQQNIYDVIIIGGGLAGGTAAYFTAKSGLKTLLVEKEKLPRYKTCGGGLIYKSVNWLPFDLSNVIEKEFYRADVFVNDIGKNFAVESSKPIVCTVMRDKFDNLILKNAMSVGAEILDSTKIISVNISNNLIEIKSLEQVFNCKYLIGADGATGITKGLFNESNSLLKVPTLESEVYVNNEIFIEFSLFPRFDFGIVPAGYAWVFPKKDHLSIGVLSLKKKINLNDFYRDYLSFLGITTIFHEEKHGYFIPINPKKTILSKNRVFLTGDANGLADPLTFEGISKAILSGKLASDAIKKYFDNPQKAGEFYTNKIKREILYENKFAKINVLFIYKKPVIRSFLFNWRGNIFTNLVTEVTLGSKQYSQLFKKSINYLKLFR